MNGAHLRLGVKMEARGLKMYFRLGKLPKLQLKLAQMKIRMGKIGYLFYIL